MNTKLRFCHLTETALMKLLRPLLGHILQYQIHTDLEIPSILESMGDYSIKCHSHIHRIPNVALYVVLKYNFEGRGYIGRPQKRWREHYKLFED